MFQNAQRVTRAAVIINKNNNKKKGKSLKGCVPDIAFARHSALFQ